MKRLRSILENRENWQPPGIEQGASDLICQCSTTAAYMCMHVHVHVYNGQRRYSGVRVRGRKTVKEVLLECR